MTPEYDSAPAWQGRGAGNIIALSTHPKHNTKRFPPKRSSLPNADATYQADPGSEALRLIVDTHLLLVNNPAPRVRLFLGPRAVAHAIRWCEIHGAGTAWALMDEVEPCSIPWPAVALVKVNQCDARPETFFRLRALAKALRQAGVGYAAFDHQEGWPNLWSRDVGGGA